MSIRPHCAALQMSKLDTFRVMNYASHQGLMHFGEVS